MSIKRNQVDRNSDSKKFEITLSIDELLKDPGSVKSDDDYEWLKKVVSQTSTFNKKEPSVDLSKDNHEQNTDEGERRLLKLFKIALHDKRLAEKFISTVISTAYLNNHRKFIFRIIMMFVEQRLYILKKAPGCYLNLVMIFGDFLHAYEGTNEIVETLFQCLMLLIEIEASRAIELATIMMSKIGLKMAIRFPMVDTDNFLDRSYHILINGEKIGPRSRILLMLMIALNDQKFLPFPDDHYLLEFYTTELGESTMTKIQNNLKTF
ncbi:uncharacterized protein LOC130666143 [Microplitis mediator]|uniref:uncharacterized protein LOC130666143 n=1 Tax=Microplitis mediator TaxID=375433 RepID=UPI002554ABF1|nr:uncharacterized protein LOC130666143 [Microplitis mediator]